MLYILVIFFPIATAMQIVILLENLFALNFLFFSNRRTFQQKFIRQTCHAIDIIQIMIYKLI